MHDLSSSFITKMYSKLSNIVNYNHVQDFERDQIRMLM